MLPKTIILGLNLHGEINVNNRVPEIKPLDINCLIQLNAVACGVANISSFTNYEMLSKEVDLFIKSHQMDWNSNYKEDELLSYVENIQRLLIKENDEEQKKIEKEYKKKISEKDCDTKLISYMKQYFDTIDKSYNISAFKEYVPIANKLFYKFSEDELKELMRLKKINKSNDYFNKISVYNSLDEMDIFTLLSSLGYTLDLISLFDLIDFLKGAGVENIIMIDLSCEVFKDEMESLTDRDIRCVRNYMQKNKLRSYKNKVA